MDKADSLPSWLVVFRLFSSLDRIGHSQFAIIGCDAVTGNVLPVGVVPFERASDGIQFTILISRRQSELCFRKPDFRTGDARFVNGKVVLCGSSNKRPFS